MDMDSMEEMQRERDRRVRQSNLEHRDEVKHTFDHWQKNTSRIYRFGFDTVFIRRLGAAAR
jgi:hypothetical protein